MPWAAIARPVLWTIAGYLGFKFMTKQVQKAAPSLLTVGLVVFAGAYLLKHGLPDGGKDKD